MNLFSNAQWFTIAKNEYRLTINTISPGLKKYFIPFVALFIIVYPTLFTPWLLNSLMDNNTALLVSQLIPLIYDVLLLNFFLIFLTLPISLGIKDVKISHLEFLLSTPLKSSDVVLGEFFGKLPFYIFGTILVAGLLTGVYSITGTDPIIVIITSILFVINFLLAYWIGTCIGFFLKGQVSKSAKMKDLGKALAFLLVVPFVFVMYATMGLVLNYFGRDYLNVDFSELLLVFPSSWIAYVSNDLVAMQTITDLYTFDFFYYLSITIIFIIIVIYLGNKLTNKIYNLEPTSFSESVVKPHNISYKFLKFIGGNGTFGTILAYNYKNYIRKYENLSKLVYAVCLMFALIFFFNNMQLDTFFAYLMAQVFSALLAGFIISEMTIQGKEKFLLYRQTPLNDWQFIISKLTFYFLLILPLVLLFNLLTASMMADFILQDYLLNLMAIILVSVALILLTTGIFLVNPPLTEKAPEFVMNFQIVIFSSTIFFFGMLISIKDLKLFGEGLGEMTFFQIQILHAIILFLTGTVLLLLGKKKLSLME